LSLQIQIFHFLSSLLVNPPLSLSLPLSTSLCPSLYLCSPYTHSFSLSFLVSRPSISLSHGPFSLFLSFSLLFSLLRCSLFLSLLLSVCLSLSSLPTHTFSLSFSSSLVLLLLSLSLSLSQRALSLLLSFSLLFSLSLSLTSLSLSHTHTHSATLLVSRLFFFCRIFDVVMFGRHPVAGARKKQASTVSLRAWPQNATPFCKRTPAGGPAAERSRLTGAFL